MTPEQRVDDLITQGHFVEMCRLNRCGLIPVTLWEWNSPAKNGISTLHQCKCGNIERVAHWSTDEESVFW